MGFEFPNDSDSSFVTKEEKAELVKSKLPFNVIRAFAFTDTGQYPGPAYRVIVDLDGEERTFTFKKGSGVDSRDETIEAMIEYFANDEAAEPISTYLAKAGNAFLLRDANATEE